MLNSSERKLIKAAKEDGVADLGAPAGQPVIHAEVLRELCTGGQQWKVKNRVRVVGARVQGRLDLAGQELPHSLQFSDCVFEDIVDLGHARADKPIEWKFGKIAGICADEFESGADLTIQKVEVGGLISLHWARVRGDLRLTDSRLAVPGGQVLNGTDLRVGGSLFLDGPGFYAEGEVCLRSAHIEGQLNFRHARFSNPLGYTIRADQAVVDGDVLCEEGFRSDGEICLQWGKLRRLRATGGAFTSSTAYALHADALRAEAGVYLDRGFHATATVRLVGANITGELCCTEGSFDNPSSRALDAERIVVSDVYLDRGFEACGEVRFTEAQVVRQFNATRGAFCNARTAGYALNADGLVCGGGVFLNEGHAVGAVSLSGAEIHSELNCTAASFDNPGGYALLAGGLTTPGMVYLDRHFRATGEVCLARATVGHQLRCTDGTFDNQRGIALDLTGMVCHGDVLLNSTRSEGRDCFRATGGIVLCDAKITGDLDFTNARLHSDEGLDARRVRVGGSLTWMLDPPPEGRINLSHAQINRLDDTAGSWPQGRYTLTGMTYQTVGSLLTHEQRKSWLGHTDVYSPDNYQQLAQVYRKAGQETDALDILIVRQRRESESPPERSRAWKKFIAAFFKSLGLIAAFAALVVGFILLWNFWRGRPTAAPFTRVGGETRVETALEASRFWRQPPRSVVTIPGWESPAVMFEAAQCAMAYDVPLLFTSRDPKRQRKVDAAVNAWEKAAMSSAANDKPVFIKWDQNSLSACLGGGKPDVNGLSTLKVPNQPSELPKGIKAQEKVAPLVVFAAARKPGDLPDVAVGLALAAHMASMSQEVSLVVVPRYLEADPSLEDQLRNQRQMVTGGIVLGWPRVLPQDTRALLRQLLTSTDRRGLLNELRTSLGSLDPLIAALLALLGGGALIRRGRKTVQETRIGRRIRKHNLGSNPRAPFRGAWQGLLSALHEYWQSLGDYRQRRRSRPQINVSKTVSHVLFNNRDLLGLRVQAEAGRENAKQLRASLLRCVPAPRLSDKEKLADPKPNIPLPWAPEDPIIAEIPAGEARFVVILEVRQDHGHVEGAFLSPQLPNLAPIERYKLLGKDAPYKLTIRIVGDNIHPKRHKFKITLSQLIGTRADSTVKLHGRD